MKENDFIFLGTHVFVGCVFTSALKSDPDVQHLLKEFVVPPGKNSTVDESNDSDSVLKTVN